MQESPEPKTCLSIRLVALCVGLLAGIGVACSLVALWHLAR
jgi:hypothetical protein